MTSNPTERTITLNGNGGAFVYIVASIACRKVEIYECQKDDATAFLPQGVDYQKTEDNFGHTFLLTPAEILPLGNVIAEGKGRGPLVGLPGQNAPSDSYSAFTNYDRGATTIDSSNVAWVSLVNGNMGITPGSDPALWAPLFNYAPATVYGKFRSATATETYVRVREWS